MTRLRVFQWRFAASMAVFLLFFAVVRLLWYPGTYFSISGTAKLLWVLLGVILIIGPVLTTLVFKPGKWGLGFDIRALAIVEIVVLLTAGAMLFERRPFYVVFAVDRFEAVTRTEVDQGKIRFDEHRIKPFGAPRFVYAQLPTDPEEHSRLIDEVVFEGRKDIDRRPEFWRPYGDGAPVVKASARPLRNLIQIGDSQQALVQRWLSRRHGIVDDYLYVPLRGRVRDAAMILHVDNDLPVGIIDIDPW